MATTISCSDGSNTFPCCDGGGNADHNFSGIIFDVDGQEHRLINQIQANKGAASVTVWDSEGNYLNVLVSDVAAAATPDELLALISVCRPPTDVLGFTREIFTNVSGNITVSKSIPADTDKLIVVSGGIIAKETDHYTISGQDIVWPAGNIPGNEVIQVFIFD